MPDRKMGHDVFGPSLALVHFTRAGPHEVTSMIFATDGAPCWNTNII